MRLYQDDKDRAVTRLGLAHGELRTAVACTPVVVAELTATRLRELLRDPHILAAEERPPLRPTPLFIRREPFPNVKQALDEEGMSYLHDTLRLIGGSTSKLAIWESGRCIDAVEISDRIDPAKNALCEPHANEVAKVAASFDIFSYLVDATYDSISEEEALSRTLGRVLPFVVINKSEALVYEKPEDYPRNALLNGEDHIIDAAANGRWSAQFVLAAGDNQGGEYVLHRSYNTLKVAMTTLSSWKNPVSPHGDRELPEIAARTSFPTGTSLSAPAVAGTLTVLEDFHGAMTVPVFARAVLLASAWHQLDPGPSWIEDVKAHRDRHYGAGELDAREAYEILTATNVQIPGQPGGDRGGWWGGASTPAKVSTFRKDYKFRLSGSGAARLRAVIAWNNLADGVPGWDGYELYDLDLILMDAKYAVAGVAATFDNNYEILETTVQRGETYTLRILGTQPPKTGDVVFGLAWTSRE